MSLTNEEGPVHSLLAVIIDSAIDRVAAGRKVYHRPAGFPRGNPTYEHSWLALNLEIVKGVTPIGHRELCAGVDLDPIRGVSEVFRGYLNARSLGRLDLGTGVGPIPRVTTCGPSAGKGRRRFGGARLFIRCPRVGTERTIETT